MPPRSVLRHNTAMRSNIFFTIFLSSALFAAVAGCTVPGSGSINGATSPAAASPTPSTAVPSKKFTPADLAKLKWIEGDWKGTGDGQEAFFERYRFENESTLAVESFDDPEMTKKSDVTRYVLQNGEFRTEREGPGYSAAEIINDSASFVPFGGARNTFKFQRISENSWTATLDWPEMNGKPARQKVYQMVRLERKK
jgi:hypothetical protein